MEELIVRHCAPTLAGMKAGSLFGYRFASHSSLLQEVSRCQELLKGKGITLSVVQIQNHRALIYVYRPNLLRNHWQCPEVRSFMERYGYHTANPEQAIQILTRRLQTQVGFPHEIGLFLGYPFADVQGFIQNKGKNCKCCGCWKVYCNEQQAKQQFERFAKCTQVYCKCFLEGTPISKLAVVA